MNALLTWPRDLSIIEYNTTITPKKQIKYRGMWNTETVACSHTFNKWLVRTAARGHKYSYTHTRTHNKI